MFRHKGQRFFCKCLTCEIFRDGGALDYRTDWYKGFKPHHCKLCKWLHRDRIGFIKEPWYIPDAIKEFLGVDTLCGACRGEIHYYFERKLHLCWGTASDEAIQLAILILIKNTLKWESRRDIHRKWIITDCLKTGRAMPSWASEEDRERMVVTV